MPDGARFKRGDSVLLRSTKEMGRVEQDATRDVGEFWYKVRFTRRVETVVEEDLEPLVDEAESLEAVVARGGWGSLRAFRTALTIGRITAADQSTIYAYRAQRILFEAFQYKPLLKILESPDRRLLIADEVGLGKTVEAGLILTELEARQPLDRVLVVCPSRLREKWRDELSRKFDQDFEIVGRSDLEDYLTRVSRAPTRTRLRAIVSMQTMRNEELRERFLAEVGAVDLLVVDEAHHARNAGTQTSATLHDLCEIAGAVLLLTATPLHLGNSDLFNLLRALRPSEFRDASVFDARLQRYKGVHEAALHVRSRSPANLRKARDILADLFEGRTPTADRDPLAVAVLRDMSDPPADGKAWVELECRVQDLHPLSSVLTRTRKRDVQEFAPVRTPKVFRCKWTPEENRAYRHLVHGSGDHGWIDQPMGIGQIQRARQAASCLPAALAALDVPAASDDDAVEQTDLSPDELAALGAVARPGAPAPAGAHAPLAHDSKFEELLKLMRFIDQEESGAKVLVFTFFVGTSRYLQKRLTDHGYEAVRIAGDVPSDPKRPDRDERGRVTNQFREDRDVRVLVSTEVGSEGLDFQFCHFLVNYDLPWNPMVVEQRIGRIDRFGQKAARLHVLNLVVEGTVEDRILLRLYERIGIFGRSIGQLESILGEEIGALQRDYVSGKLTPAEAERRVEEAARAIDERRARLEELEQRAGNLFGHEEYLKDQLRRVNRLGRYISARAMLAVIETYLQALHPGVKVWDDPPGSGVYHLRLSDGLRREIRNASGAENPWAGGTPKGELSFCFDGQQAYERPRAELINVSHPFLKAAVAAVGAQLEHAQSRAARALLPLRPGEDEELAAGEYFVLVFAHAVEGIRARRVLETVAWSADRRELLPADLGERLLHLVQEEGVEWDLAQASGPLPADAWATVGAEARARNRALLDAEKRENAALYLRRKALLEAEHAHEVEIKTRRVDTARERGRTRVLPALEAQIEKAGDLFRSRLEGLDRTREARCRLSEPLAACLIRVVRSEPPTGAAQ